MTEDTGVARFRTLPDRVPTEALVEEQDVTPVPELVPDHLKSEYAAGLIGPAANLG